MVEKVKSLDKPILTSQTAGVRKPVFESLLTGLTPAKLGGLLKDAKSGKIEAYLTIAEEMEERDLQYRTVLNTRKLQIISTPYKVIEPLEGKVNPKIVQFIEEVVNQASFAKMLFHLLDSLGKGFSVVEIMYELKNNLYFPKDYVYKPQQWFVFNQDFSQVLLRVTDKETKELPQFKTICHIPTLKSGSPIRGGLAFGAASIFILKNYGIKDWGALIEVFGSPIRLGKYDDVATEDDRTKLLQAVTDIGSDFAAIIPNGMDIEFIDAKVNSNGDLYRKYIDYLDEQLTKLVLGQTMTTDNGSSRSQAEVHNEIRETILKADAQGLAETINNYLIKPVIDLNFGAQSFYPYLEFDFTKEDEKEKIVDIYTKTYAMGIPFSIEEYRVKTGISEPKDDKEDSSLTYKPNFTKEELNTISLNNHNHEYNSKNIEDKEEDEENEEAIVEAMEPITKDLEGFLESSKSIEDALENIDKLQLNTKKLQNSLLKDAISAVISVFKGK